MMINCIALRDEEVTKIKFRTNDKFNKEVVILPADDIFGSIKAKWPIRSELILALVA